MVNSPVLLWLILLKPQHSTHPIEATTLYSNVRSGSKNSYGGKGNSEKEGPICTYYGKVGHIADKCYKLIGFPPGFKFKNKSMANQVSCN